MRKYLSALIAFSLLMVFAVVGRGSPPTKQKQTVAVVKTAIIAPAVSETAEVAAVTINDDATNRLNKYDYNVTGILAGDYARVESRAPGIRSRGAKTTKITTLASVLDASPPATWAVMKV